MAFILLIFKTKSRGHFSGRKSSERLEARFQSGTCVWESVRRADGKEEGS
jgi:hypothetical protein